MKKLICVITLLILISPVVVMAEQYSSENEHAIYILRAGGGSSGGSGGSGGSGSSSHGHGSNSSSYDNNPISYILNLIIFLVITFIGSIILYIKVLRSAINSKRYLKLLSKKDISWKYKNIEKQAITTFYSVQDSWTNMNMEPSKEYMSKKLYDSFVIKLNFMEANNKRNVLKMINLIDIKPVSIYDDEDNEKDFVWFYIKGFMVDYTINTETKEKIDGTEFPTSFIEFWEFTRKGKDKWVLSKIKQIDEADTIVFQQKD